VNLKGSELNVIGALNVADVFVDDLIAAAEAGQPADLVNMSSIVASRLSPRFPTYAATKAFLSYLSRNLRVELSPNNVRVTTVAPGIVTTELWQRGEDPASEQWLEQTHADGQFLRPKMWPTSLPLPLLYRFTSTWRS
jgi:short-subunit dehydrogenase